MSIKTILCVLNTNQNGPALDAAIAMAGAENAHLMVLVLGVAPSAPASPYGVVSSDIWVRESESGRALVQERADAIEEKFAQAGISASVTAQYIEFAAIASLTARFARYADITLIWPEADGLQSFQRSVMDGALFESGRPVLLMPENATEFPRCKSVLIAWDASVEASKAVRDAIPIMCNAGKVAAVLVDPEPSFDGHGQEPGADLGAYLSRHDVDVAIHRVPSEGRDVSEILARFATDQAADLIVMGGYAHSRLRQRIFGGTTTRMMKDLKVPVLMAH